MLLIFEEVVLALESPVHLSPKLDFLWRICFDYALLHCRQYRKISLIYWQSV
jgi:hypothetical protein